MNVSEGGETSEDWRGKEEKIIEREISWKRRKDKKDGKYDEKNEKNKRERKGCWTNLVEGMSDHSSQY